jgi:hypothetical protein
MRQAGLCIASMHVNVLSCRCAHDDSGVTATGRVLACSPASRWAKAGESCALSQDRDW